MNLLGKVLVVGAYSSAAFEELPPHLRDPKPASSKRDPPMLAKAKSKDNTGLASGMTYLRWRKNYIEQKQLQPEKTSENM